MKRFKSLLIFGFVLTIFQSFGQSYEADILRFSMYQLSGSARYISVGGAFTSVGADITNLNSNPAGIGMYRNSVAQASFGVHHQSLFSSYLNDEERDNKINVSIPNAGFVFAGKNKEGSLIKANFGLAIQRTGEYNSNEYYSAFNDTPFSSVSWNYADEMSTVFNGLDVSGIDLSDVSFDTYLGFYGFLANYDTTIMNYTSPVVDSIQQTRFVENSGGKTDFAFGVGANYIDKLYFGASIAIPVINFERETNYQEEDEFNATANTFFNKSTLITDYQTEGLGFNVKMGILYKVNDWVRIGGSIQSPERISLTERYSSDLTTDLDFDNLNYTTGEGVFEYKVRLPWRASAGASLFFKKHGFLSVDYEAVGYNSMRYIFENQFRDVSSQLNSLIQAKYQVGHNIKVGVEGVIDIFRIRAGYNYLGSPIAKEYVNGDYDFSRQVITGGIGFLFDKVAVDFAYMHQMQKQFEQPYVNNYATIPGVQKRITNGMGVVSVAYRLR